MEDELGQSHTTHRDRVLTSHPPAAEDESESEEEEDDGPADDEAPALPPGKNEMLTVGYKGRSFVVRGNNIGVFSHTGTGEIGYVATIQNVATPKGKAFKPSEVRRSLSLFLTRAPASSASDTRADHNARRRSSCTNKTPRWCS